MDEHQQLIRTPNSLQPADKVEEKLFSAEEVVSAAMQNMTNQINKFFGSISVQYPPDNPLPLRERLAVFFGGDRFSSNRPDRVKNRPDRVKNFLPELEASFVNKPSHVSPSFEIKSSDGLLIKINSDNFSLGRENNQDVSYWVDLSLPHSQVAAFSLGRELNPQDEPDQAINEGLKIGRIPSQMFGSTKLDYVAAFASLAYSRTTQAEWAHEKRNVGVYKLLAEYNIINHQLDAQLATVTYGPVDVYGYVKEINYKKDHDILTKKEPIKTRDNRWDHIAAKLHSLCPETVQLENDGYFLISPTDPHHPPLAIKDIINISNYVDPMLIFDHNLKKFPLLIKGFKFLP